MGAPVLAADCKTVVEVEKDGTSFMLWIAFFHRYWTVQYEISAEILRRCTVDCGEHGTCHVCRWLLFGWLAVSLTNLVCCSVRITRAAAICTG